MFSGLVVVVVAAVALASSKMALAQCPCHYGDNVNYVICADTSITSIPDCVPANITRLSIETPSIPLVSESIRRFTHLQNLDIAFFDNPKLSKNFLVGNRNIADLGIYHTSLDYVDNEWFLYAPRITTLELYDNNIVLLAADTFSSLPLLEIVDLNNNLLSTLPPALFEGTSLKNLYIDDNPWQCDCELATFIQWTRDSGVTVSDGAFCLHPLDFEGVNVKDLTPDLTCK